MHKRLTSEAEILVYFAVWTLVFKLQGPRKSVMHWMTPNYTWTLNSQKYFIYTIYLLQTLKFWSVSPDRFSRYKVTKNQKCTEWPQTEFEHLHSKVLYTSSWRPNFGPFRSTINRFRDTICTRLPKIGDALNDLKLNLKTWQSNVLCMH